MDNQKPIADPKDPNYKVTVGNNGTQNLPIVVVSINYVTNSGWFVHKFKDVY